MIDKGTCPEMSWVPASEDNSVNMVSIEETSQSHWCLVGNGWMGWWLIVSIDHSPHSLRSAPVSNFSLSHKFSLSTTVRLQDSLSCLGPKIDIRNWNAPKGSDIWRHPYAWDLSKSQPPHLSHCDHRRLWIHHSRWSGTNRVFVCCIAEIFWVCDNIIISFWFKFGYPQRNNGHDDGSRLAKPWPDCQRIEPKKVRVWHSYIRIKLRLASTARALTASLVRTVPRGAVNVNHWVVGL